MQIWTLCNIALVFGLLLIGGCARESENDTPPRNLKPTQFGNLKNGYKVLWRYVFLKDHSHASTDPQVRGHWEGDTLIVNLSEEVSIYEIFITAKFANGENVDIPISLSESAVSPCAQFLVVKGRVQLRIQFNTGHLPQQIDVVRTGRM